MAGRHRNEYRPMVIVFVLGILAVAVLAATLFWSLLNK